MRKKKEEVEKKLVTSVQTFIPCVRFLCQTLCTSPPFMRSASLAFSPSQSCAPCHPLTYGGFAWLALTNSCALLPRLPRRLSLLSTIFAEPFAQFVCIRNLAQNCYHFCEPGVPPPLRGVQAGGRMQKVALCRNFAIRTSVRR